MKSLRLPTVHVRERDGRWWIGALPEDPEAWYDYGTSAEATTALEARARWLADVFCVPVVYETLYYPLDLERFTRERAETR